ncbi:glycosyltransferase family 4 protein [Winogradskyella psychrotolerans]|uniref:glycosyltransferase family 4 protein n=1 Tax=Winogradskyella psychrotolerans TaxID=1344585 RepID=UPI001C07B019|nr:glycosyltransferase family 4 protein [Winogradskyella psychrotolerans]MBU2929547.1 glycosyltransferase family 4 protein [Winogradskyella psychrotolerans]
MKIALVLSSAPSYSETFFNALIDGLKSNGHDVNLFTGSDSSTYMACTHIKNPGIHRLRVIQILNMMYHFIILVPYFKVVKRFFYLEKRKGTPHKRIIEKIYLNAALLKFKGEWVHFGFATTALEREMVPLAIRAKMAVSFRGYDINVYPLKHQNCYTTLWNQVDKVHSISNFLLLKAYSLGLKKETKFKIISPAIDFKNRPEINLQSNTTKFKITTIARFNWIKGLDYLTEIASRLKTAGFEFEWTLIGDNNSSEKERFLFEIKEKSLENYIKLQGQCSHEDTLAVLKNSDVYIQTSLMEGFCNAVLEAQFMGIPTIAFRVGGLPENISNHKTGWLIEPYDLTEMKDMIIAVSKLSTEKRVEIGQNAINRVVQNFNMEQQKEAFQEFYTNDF